MTHASSDANTLLTPTWFATRKVCSHAVVSCAVFFAVSCSVMFNAFAAEPSDEKPAEVAAPTYTVSQSTPIDKVIQTVYANSPLNVSVLRKVLVDANPKVITGNPQQRVKAGTTLTIPEHGQVLKNILSPHVAAVPETPEPGPSARDVSARRQWVRFP